MDDFKWLLQSSGGSEASHHHHRTSNAPAKSAADSSAASKTLLDPTMERFFEELKWLGLSPFNCQPPKMTVGGVPDSQHEQHADNTNLLKVNQPHSEFLSKNGMQESHASVSEETSSKDDSVYIEKIIYSPSPSKSPTRKKQNVKERNRVVCKIKSVPTNASVSNGISEKAGPKKKMTLSNLKSILKCRLPSDVSTSKSNELTITWKSPGDHKECNSSPDLIEELIITPCKKKRVRFDEPSSVEPKDDKSASSPRKVTTDQFIITLKKKLRSVTVIESGDSSSSSASSVCSSSAISTSSAVVSTSSLSSSSTTSFTSSVTSTVSSISSSLSVSSVSSSFTSSGSSAFPVCSSSSAEKNLALLKGCEDATRNKNKAPADQVREKDAVSRADSREEVCLSSDSEVEVLDGSDQKESPESKTKEVGVQVTLCCLSSLESLSGPQNTATLGSVNDQGRHELPIEKPAISKQTDVPHLTDNANANKIRSVSDKSAQGLEAFPKGYKMSSSAEVLESTKRLKQIVKRAIAVKPLKKLSARPHVLYKCIYCNYGASTKRKLREHLRTHLSKKQLTHECQVCSKVFRGITALLDHLQTHLMDTKLQCSVCGKLCQTESELVSHTVSEHSEKKHFQCIKCNMVFPTLIALQSHREQGCVGLNGELSRLLPSTS